MAEKTDGHQKTSLNFKAMEEVSSSTTVPENTTSDLHELKTEKEHDANDYSRFENISDSDDDDNNNSNTSASKTSNREILSFHESYYRSQSLKEMGNVAFKENNYVLAKQHYEEALEIIKPHKNTAPINDITPEKAQEMKNLYISLHGNKSMVHLKEENWVQVIKSTNEILKDEPENVKALYRRAVAHHRTGDFDVSKEGLNLVLALDSSNVAAKKELAEVLKSIKEQKRKEKNAMSNMFTGESIYGDREAERQKKIRREKEAEEKLHDQYLQEKLKKRSEGESESEVEKTFEEWKKDRKKKEEDEKKKEEERKKLETESARKKQKTIPRGPKKTSTENNNNADGVEYDEEDSKIINETTSKGYCYFKRQLPTAENQLIGDITPKAVTSPNPTLENSPTPNSTAATTGAGGGAGATATTTEKSSVEASSWNHAGTWEERDTTVLVKDRMKELCLLASASLNVGETPVGSDMQSALSDAMKAIDMKSGSPDSLQNSLEAMKTAISPISASVTEVQSIEGEAQIVLTRGKKCYLYDFTIKLKIEVTVAETPFSESLEGNEEKRKPQVFKGTLEISDVCPGTGFEWNLTFKKSNIPERVRRCAHKLKDDIFSKLQSFDTEYRNL